MIKKKLNEDAIEQIPENNKEVQKTENDLEEPLVSNDDGEIEAILNKTLRVNLRNQRNGDRNFLNILFVGEAGTGKTARIKSWARAHGINLVTVKAGELDDTDTGGVIAGNIEHQVAVRLASTEFDQLDKPNSVLFLDEWNRAPSTVRQSLLTLIQDHTVTDPRINGRMRYIPNFLFTVAAINPYDIDYDVQQLDSAEFGRVSRKVVSARQKDWGDYMVSYYNQLSERAKDEEDKLVYKKIANLANALASSPKFEFDTREVAKRARDEEAWNGLLTTPRNVTNALEEAEGDKEEFLAVWNDHCNNLEYKNIEGILGDYVDIDDKANQALKGYTPKKDKIFKSQKEQDIDILDSIKNDILNSNNSN